MYLKKLDMQGFKSFAEKISLEFNSGITSIVGPNGSGKSNIADALRWVLGEQSVRTLRGSKMEDVIFAGTEHRKPLGFAEVSITIDNSDAALPVEFSEVTVTRRMFRSGESEYFINKTSCRLKDIYELFLDTGIGKDGYSIIGQGRIDEILSNRSEERRHIFEEASGIMKYKLRKIETEKKLELTKQNLVRINDIINELEIQLEPLKQQAETARKFLALRDGLKELEVNVYIDSITKFKEKLKEYEKQYDVLREDIESENAKLLEITENNRIKTELLRSLEERINNSRNEYYAIEGNLERCNSEIKLNEEKINHLNGNINRIDSELAEIDQKLAALSRDEDAKRKRIEYLNSKYEEYSKKLAEYEKQMETILAQLDETERHIESLKSGIMDKLDLLSDKRTQINSLKAHIESLKKRRDHINAEVQQLIVDKDREGMKKEDLVESIRKSKEAIRLSKTKIDSLNIEKNRLDTSLEELRKTQNALKSDIQFKKSRLSMLQDMEKNFEGYNRSVRAVLQSFSDDSGLNGGIHGALAQLVKVEARYETAIEMSLGSALQNIVASSEEDAKKAIEFLKKNRLGRATFLPISSVKGRYFDEGLLGSIKAMEGFCGVASDLVSCDERYRGIILSFLGRVAVVEDLDAGIRMARKFGYSFRIVTLEGDILSASGSISGGSAESGGTGILSRHREIDDLKGAIQVLAKEEYAVEASIRKAVASLEGKLQAIEAEQKALKDSELVKIRDESHLAQIEENISKTAARIDMLKQEKEQLSRQEAEEENELQKYSHELAGMERNIADTKKAISEHQEKHKEGQSVRDALHSDITDFKISVNSILESIEGVKEAIGSIGSEKEVSVKLISRKNLEKTRSIEEIESLREKNAGYAESIRKLEEEKTGKVFEMDRSTEEKKVIEDELYDLVNQIGDINKNISLLQEDINRVDVRKAKLESEMEAIQNRMWDEYELTYTNALPLKKDIGSLAQAQKKIADYKNQIRELGPVNIAAIEDYVKTRERYEFMSAQRDDMQQAEEKLRRVIGEVTSIMKKQFLEQFRLINENFNIVFNELFEGGYARLKLVDDENVLESGIEIEVQPPGKKLQNMMLLSGGERAFTAIALLFAILRLHPTPFCVLDEIEASLDDANVFRFNQYLRDFANRTQFVIVTHRKGTMEASDILYGVTMQERGVSKIVSLKIAEKAS